VPKTHHLYFTFRFKNWYASPIEDARSKDATSHMMRIGEKANTELQNKLRPYFIQRLKIDFLADMLPKKRDFVVWTHLSDRQRSMYSKYVEAGDSAVAQVLTGISTSPLEAVTWLKKLCGHPILVDKNGEVYSESLDRIDPDALKKYSSKLQVLDALIERLRSRGHRTLIFSQSTKMLDIIERVLHRAKLSRIDGSTKEKDRQRRVDEFNRKNTDVEVMLLSTKAAGVGLTLTGADRAIVYDPSWNPAEDSQAVDRCYRIGQNKEVSVFRFITAGTVEEKVRANEIGVSCRLCLYDHCLTQAFRSRNNRCTKNKCTKMALEEP
jgi:SNF2 family DNA or RNA helicase